MCSSDLVKVGDNPIRPGIVHRLDKEVSGLIVLALNNQAFQHLKEQFKKRTVLKEYQALVYGQLDKDNDEITFQIGRASCRERV